MATSPWAIPDSYLGDDSRKEDVVEAIKLHHRIIEAQYLATTRSSTARANKTIGVDLNTNATVLGLKDSDNATKTFTHPHRHRDEDTRGLIGSMLILFVVSWAYTPNTKALLYQPTTIASSAALIVCVTILDLMPENAAWVSPEDIVASFPSGTWFKMGWTQINIRRDRPDSASTTATGDDISSAENQGEAGKETGTGEVFGIVATLENDN